MRLLRIVLLVSVLSTADGCRRRAKVADPASQQSATADSASPSTLPSTAPAPQALTASAPELRPPVYVQEVRSGGDAQTGFTEMNTESLTRALAVFQKQKGRAPVSLEEMAKEKLIPYVPKPPPGKTFVIDPGQGRVVLAPK